MNNFLLYFTTVFVWGSTWLAIKYQISDVDPMVAVVYRFALAAVLLLSYCGLAGLKMRFSRKEHLFMALQGALLFSLNYWLVYLSEVHLTSGLVALLFSTIVFMNVVNGRLFLKSPVRAHMVVGAVLGMIGIGLIFWREIASFHLSDKGLYGLLVGLGAVFLASLGNITSARNQKHDLPVIQTNAFGMAYGAVIMLAVAVIAGKAFTFPLTVSFVGSLFYLSIFGSVVAFGFYLTLVGRIGADKASYALMLTTIVALGFSTVFEGYRWTPNAFIGMGFVLAGNLMLLNKQWFRARAGAPSRRDKFSQFSRMLFTLMKKAANY